MQNIAIDEVIVAAKGIAPRVYPPKCRIVRVFRYREWRHVPLEYEYTAGADTIWYRLGSHDEQLTVILDIKRVLIKYQEIPEQNVHNALLVIPEYRAHMLRVARRTRLSRRG